MNWTIVLLWAFVILIGSLWCGLVIASRFWRSDDDDGTYGADEGDQSFGGRR